MIGTVLGGRYEILEEIGNGGMAHVYKARCTLLNRIVALKILRDDLEGENEFLKRFNVEAQAAASLTHSNIVSIFDVGCDNGRHYIVMEYIDGITLKEYISENKTIPYREAISIAYQICGALQAAHHKNIVHRDIKPHNILITEEGKIKVTDFGIARSGNRKTISSGSDIIGSVHYISPEQAKGDLVDTRSDIYSLGIVIHEMITGRVPFDGDTPVAVAMQQIEAKASNEYLMEMCIPIAVQQLIFKAMAKEPELRYQNANEIKSDILNILHDSNYRIENGDLYINNDNNTDDETILKRNNKKTVKNPVVKVLLVIAALLTSVVVVALSIFAYINGVPEMIKNYFNEEIVIVPELAEMTLSEAKDECEDLGINVVVENEIDDPTLLPGEIVSQTPDAGKEIKPNETIKVVINRNSENFILEDYEGEAYEAVKEELEDEGFTVDIVFEESKKDENIILRQSPDSGKNVKKDSIIILYVSSGVNASDKYITVPNLIDQTYSQCSSILKKLGLEIDYSSKNRPAANDIVIEQSIPAKSLVNKGCTITVTVAENKESTESESETNTEDGTTSNVNSEDEEQSTEDDIANNSDDELGEE